MVGFKADPPALWACEEDEGKHSHTPSAPGTLRQEGQTNMHTVEIDEDKSASHNPRHKQFTYAVQCSQAALHTLSPHTAATDLHSLGQQPHATQLTRGPEPVISGGNKDNRSNTKSCLGPSLAKIFLSSRM